MARGRTLGDYLQNGVNLQADNGQVRALSHAASDKGEPPYGACTPAMLQIAMDNLSGRYALVGVTERFDEFLALAGRVLGWRHLGYARRKVTKSRPAVEALDASERAMIMRYNSLDVELYALARSRAEALARG
jgi:hypothetical protein